MGGRFRRQIDLIPRAVPTEHVADQFDGTFVDADESIRRTLRIWAEAILREHFDEDVEALLFLAERARDR